MTEASSLATFSNKEVNAPASVGIPLVKTKVAAFEPGTQNELPTGQIGELNIQSTNLMNEYYEKPEETAKVKQHHIDGDWIHSGDIGYVDKNGIVFVNDRIKRMIIRSGFKVFPTEIEKVITGIDYVDLCAVVGVPDEVDVNAPKVYITVNESGFDVTDLEKKLLWSVEVKDNEYLLKKGSDREIAYKFSKFKQKTSTVLDSYMMLDANDEIKSVSWKTEDELYVVNENKETKFYIPKSNLNSKNEPALAFPNIYMIEEMDYKLRNVIAIEMSQLE